MYLFAHIYGKSMLQKKVVEVLFLAIAQVNSFRAERIWKSPRESYI